MLPIETDIHDLREDVAEIREMVAGHEVRFSNGREVMGEMKADIASLKPKAPNWLKLLGMLAGLFVVTLGAHYWLIEQFNDRPTSIQIEKAFHEHSELGHASTRHDIDQIRENQMVQRVLLDSLSTTVTGQGKKLDTILNRLPVRSRPREP